MSPRAADLSAWTKSHLGLVHVVEKTPLPVPIALSWDPYREELGVQVQEASYRAWMDAVASPVLESKPHDGTTHLYATGELRSCRMVKVRVVAVCHTVGELPEVGGA